jgi:hypothetical protein
VAYDFPQDEWLGTFPLPLAGGVLINQQAHKFSVAGLEWTYLGYKQSEGEGASNILASSSSD